MISLNFGFWHSGAKLSYLRYLTFKTLRYFHPDSKITLYVGGASKDSGHIWNREKQDFETPNDIKVDYLEKLPELNVEIKHVDFFSQYAENYRADIFRWWFIKNCENGGVYLDTDQIILRSFETLPLENDLIYSKYVNPQCGWYAPVGVILASKSCKIVDYIMANIMKYYNPNNYNSIGPFMFLDVIKGANMKNTFNAPSHYFYPALHSDLVPLIYNGSLKIPDDSYALHLFLGHPASQAFNKKYTEEMSKKSNDTISRFLRNKKII